MFNLNLRTLRPVDGKMIELIQYDLSETTTDPNPAPTPGGNNGAGEGEGDGGSGLS